MCDSTTTNADLVRFFSEGGPLSEYIEGYKPRKEQIGMAIEIANACRDKSKLVVEAGTGVGKTIAYLIPILKRGEKAIISTGTKNLQEQIVRKDLPVVRQMFQEPFRYALLKGRNNYLCLERYQQWVESLDQSSPDQRLATHLYHWLTGTDSGDLAETDVSEKSPVWPLITSTVDNCIGQNCESYKDCFVFKARKTAQDADLIVVNHHLLLADMVLKEDGFGEILPTVNTFVLDEAHQLPSVASIFFGLHVSSRQIKELVIDLEVVVHDKFADTPDFLATVRLLGQELDRLIKLMGSKQGRFSWNDLPFPNIEEGFEKIHVGLKNLSQCLEMFLDRDRIVDVFHKRTLGIQHRLETMLSSNENVVSWIEIFPKSFVLHQTPLSFSENFQKQYAKYPSATWVFTSATLTVDDQFDHFQQNMGLEDCRTYRAGSVFDFAQQALVYLPAHLPNPQQIHYTKAMLDVLRPLIETNQGGTFLLFTSHKALIEAAKYLKATSERPLFVQGERGRDEILHLFRQSDQGILLGAQSFWEGVDVRGVGLTLVIIDKLPFSSPSDPLMKAKIDHIREQGGNPFKSFQLPHAIIGFKQGVGRLIRDQHDYGVIVVCDPRIRTANYGRSFLRCLPDAPITADLSEAIRFLRSRQIKMIEPSNCL